MKRLFILMCVIPLLTTGCFYESVPPANKGKILGPSGYSPEVLEPGRHWVGFRESLIRLDTSTAAITETIEIPLGDNMKVTADVRVRARVGGTPSVINSMFNDIQVQNGVVALTQIYSVYGRDVVRGVTRQTFNDLQLSTTEIFANFSLIGAALEKNVIAAMEGNPLTIERVTLSNITLPKVIQDATELAAQRELDIKKAEAEAEIKLVEKENQRRLAEANYEVEITKAEAIRDANKIIADGVTADLLEFRRLDIMERFAEASGGEGNTVYIPIEGMTSVGAQQRMFSDQR